MATWRSTSGERPQTERNLNGAANFATGFAKIPRLLVFAHEFGLRHHWPPDDEAGGRHLPGQSRSAQRFSQRLGRSRSAARESSAEAEVDEWQLFCPLRPPVDDRH